MSVRKLSTEEKQQSKHMPEPTTILSRREYGWRWRHLHSDFHKYFRGLSYEQRIPEMIDALRVIARSTLLSEQIAVLIQELLGDDNLTLEERHVEELRLKRIRAALSEWDPSSIWAKRRAVEALGKCGPGLDHAQ